MENKLVVFKGKEIRRILHSNEWWFVIVDVVSALTDSINPSGYIKDMKRRDKELSFQFRLKAGLICRHFVDN